MYSKIFCVVFVATLVGSTVALPKQDNSEKDLLNMIEKMDNVPSLPLFGGLRIDRVENGRSFGSSKAVESFDERAERYLETHQLNFSFPDDDEEEDDFNGRSIEESRSKKMKKMLLPLLLLLKLKKAVVIKVLFTVIKFISLKSLAISLLALFFAGATFFKDLLGKKKEHITTAYITGSPLNAEIVHSDWNRNGQAAASELAYNHYGLAQPF
ncbi:uncharacterized protein LOC119634634 [Glossina fuscipes]|uniref:Uncharacterized protein LOC119634634 n=2 Tax=Nemorhina TaxID=44051 RepID=A0A8U0WI76_9MUSC|nr:uncharacterized protein LOC119634634 [Glossina fuscipes]KAI9584861.1 hypothetical protein GQX74_006756 [Glossina fuscipes]